MAVLGLLEERVAKDDREHTAGDDEAHREHDEQCDKDDESAKHDLSLPHRRRRGQPSRPPARSAGVGDDLDLDPGAERKVRNCDGRPGRTRVGKELAILLVQGGEVVHVSQKHGGLHDL